MTIEKKTVSQARLFALATHGDQRYGDKPYSYHLDAVADLVRGFGEEAEIVAYLHDVVEDTKTSIEEITETFGPEIASQVLLITDPQGRSRRERKQKMNVRLISVRLPDGATALIVKAADRLANLRESANRGERSKLSMYRGEHKAFRAAAYRPGLCDELWHEMDEILAFTTTPTE